MITDLRVNSSRIVRSAKLPTLREARFEDHSQIATLAGKFHLLTENYSAWTQLWTHNPAYRGIKNTFPIGWVLENGDGIISGYLGNIPLHYEFGGQRLLAAATRSWVVDTAYRAYSLLLLETYFQQRYVDLFMNTTINSQAASAYSTFHGVRVPVGNWDRARFWVTNSRGFSESFLRNKGWALAPLLSYPLSVGIILQQFGGNRLNPTVRVTVKSCSCFDYRFDRFWRNLRAKNSNLLLAVRTREVLEWHFRFPLLQKRAWIYVLEANSELSAYAVFLRQDSPEIGLTRVRLVDFQCLEQEQSLTVLIAMLCTALDRCRKESIHMLELIGLPPQFEGEIERVSPHGRRLPNWMYCYKTNNTVLGERLKNPAVWQPSLFDGDCSL
jgi:hypothetical protein